ncbi:HTH_Tnp_Tc3_1 domain-containing protein [Trichonephila clavipes]|nr:HTH_Tnp_Tc3_1 domain-containing protein [Trichonephila clavipes]
MAGCQDLSEFERGVIVGTREMGHSISEIGPSTNVTVRTVQRNILDMGFVVEVVPMCFCLRKPDEDVDTTLLFPNSVTQGTKPYASPGPVNTNIGLMLTGNTLPGLTSLVFNCIEQIDVYDYGDNLMNPWTYMSTGDYSS